MPQISIRTRPAGRRVHARARRTEGIALVLVLGALLVLSFIVLAMARRVDQGIFLAGRDNRTLEARALAYSGLQIALHPQSSPRTPALRRQTDRAHSYQARITGEGGKLQLNWFLAGEDPVKIKVLRAYLGSKGFKPEQLDVFIDCMLDYVTPGNLKHLNGSRTTVDGSPVPGKPFQDLAEVRRVVGSEPLTRLEDWEGGFTLWSQGPIDLKWANEELISAVPGVGDSRARAFIQQRQGADKIDGTIDDFPIDNVQQAAQFLGFNQQTFAVVQPLLSVNDPTVRIVSLGQAADVSHTIEVVVRKLGMQPQIIQWKEY